MSLSGSLRRIVNRMVGGKGEGSNVPGFIIVGAQKGGTTYLFNLLSRHPNLWPAPEKEIRFFSQDIAFERGLQWYRSFFPPVESLRRGDLAFEASPDYLFSPDAAARIAALCPGVKLIVTLRNPTERAYSAWNMYRVVHQRPVLPCFPASRFDKRVRDSIHRLIFAPEFPSFEESVRQEMAWKRDGTVETDFVAVGYYDEQIARYLACFDRDRILVITQEAMQADSRRIASRIAAFLEIPAFEWPEGALPRSNTADYEEPMGAEIEATLNEVYRPHNERLAELIGFDPGWSA